MNQRPQGLQAEKAITGFLQYKSAEGLAPVTVSGYERDLKLWLEYQGEIRIGKISSQHILEFLNYLRTEYVPRRITGDNSRKLSPKTVYNIYVSLAAELCRIPMPAFGPVEVHVWSDNFLVTTQPRRWWELAPAMDLNFQDGGEKRFQLGTIQIFEELR